MKQNIIMKRLLLTILFLSNTLLQARSIHRPKDPTKPRLTARWIDDNEYHSISNYYLQEYPFFQIFDRNHFFENYLPIGTINFRNNPNSSVEGATLAHLIDKLMEEIAQGKKEFTNFIVLRKQNFNRRKKFGLLILKCKDYPFVVKTSIETPKSFTNPYKKGIVPAIFFFMAGGINRHLSGFTRIKNSQYVRQCITQAPNLPAQFDIPRKWFYMPSGSKWMELCGFNIGQHDQIHTEIPGAYCIIADAIECERSFSLLHKDDRTISMKLCNLVNFYIDPHIDNFIVEKETNKIVIIDTEHFPSITGLANTKSIYTSQIRWYTDLSIKCLEDMFLRDKQTRRYIQRHGTHHYKL